MRLRGRAGYALLAIGLASGAAAQVATGKIADPAQARSDYVENCGGCHGISGDSAPALLPVLRARVGYFLCDPDARAYLIRLPNVAHSRITDNAELADLLNYVVFDLGGASAPASAAPFTGEEVTRERPRALSDVSLTALRGRLVERVIRSCKAPASLRLLYPRNRPHKPADPDMVVSRLRGAVRAHLADRAKAAMTPGERLHVETMEQDQDDVPVMRIRVRQGAYTCGTETIEQILRAALTVLVEEGSSAFTLRRIAAECAMKVGNLSYYFPRKEDLVQELLEAILNGYTDLAADELRDVSDDPEERLRCIISFTLDDIRSKRTTNLFPELWALANHNEKVDRLVQEFYARAQRGIAEAVKGVNASLSDEDCRTVALFISATIEGTTIFAGHSKPWEPKMPEIKALAILSLLNLAKTLRSQDLRAFRRRRSRVEA